MILRATDVGELASKIISKDSEGRATRRFRNSVYIEVGHEVLLLLDGRLRSPMTINLTPTASFEDLVSVGEQCFFAQREIRFSRLTVETEGAKLYRSNEGPASVISPVDSPTLAKGIVALRVLLEVSESKLAIATSNAFRQALDSVLIPMSKGELAGAYLTVNYMPLIGTGGGFTPAGDDFVAGFTAAFNYMARRNGITEILLPRQELEKRTVRESAVLLDYAQRGLVDEELERLILSSFGNEAGQFFQNLMEVAKRGHTSGIDMSVGVVLAVAAVRDMKTREGSLETCLTAFGMGRRGTL